MIIKVHDGFLEGREGLDYDGNKFFSFQGIPYAKPPVGNLRFKAPQPPEPWPHVRDATKEGNPNLSKDFLTFEPVGSEDCLYLNVYSRNLPSEQLQPVMFWIHGGGYLCGSGSSVLYGPEYLLTENVVLVTSNFRLGALGYLNLEDESLEVTGNAGLKDIVMALEWVQRNISQFGGDPHNVTIFGHSAGGSSVNFLMVSPLAKGLFHRALILSGSASCFWATGKSNGKDVASALGFESTNENEILKFLQKQPAEKFLEVQEILKETLIPSKIRRFAPVVEKPNPTAFITRSAIDSVKSGHYNKVPFMIGYTTEESIFLDIFTAIMDSHKFTDFEETVPFDLDIAVGSKESKDLAVRIKKFYFGDKDPSKNEMDVAHYKLISDVSFIKDIIRLAKLVRSTSPYPVYLYRFSAETRLNVFRALAKYPYPGASHADELPYIFKMVVSPEISPGSTEDICLRRMVKLFANFARNGNPTPPGVDSLVEWKPLADGETNCLDIGTELKNLSIVPEIERYNFWERIYNDINE